MFRFVAERFVGTGESETLENRFKNLSPENSLVLLLVFVAVIFVNLFVIKYLWNNVLSNAVNVKKIDLWMALGLKVLVLALVS